ncbi:MAG: HDIG domain-containing protein [Planctomyces sp.]|nr:HDIG domain-containing protein [Planctomyces sp.]
MAGPAPKRSRLSRTGMTVRPRETVWNRLVAWGQDRSILLRLGICLQGLLLLLIVLQTWKGPFPYRVGMQSGHGIAARINFGRIDIEATARARDRAEYAVARIFKSNSEDMRRLPQQLRAALGEIASAETLQAVPAATRLDFGLEAPPPEDRVRARAHALFGQEPASQRFEALRETIVGPAMETANQRIEDLIADFSKFITPVLAAGLIDPDEEERLRLTADRKIVAVAPDGERSEEVLLPKVRLSDQLNDAGDLGSRWLSYPSLSKSIQPAISHWLMARAKPTLAFDQVTTKAAETAARSAVPDVQQQFIVGDLLVRPGQAITESEVTLLLDEYAAYERQIDVQARLARMLIVFLMMVVLAALNGYYIVHNEPRIVRSLRRLLVFLAAIVITAGLARPLSYDPYRAEIVPLLITVMVLAVAYNQVLATLTAFSICLALTFSTTAQFGHFVVLFSTCAAVVIPLSQVGSRSKLIKVSVFSAVTYFVVNIGVGVVQAQALSEAFSNLSLLNDSLKGAVYCMVAGYLVAGTLPFVESLFGVVTDISLLELSDPSHPLLQELVRRAPGTYNHSIAVATIAEAAAEAIDANGLLVRVGAYFHDIGKMLKPQYFIENMQAGAESRHEHLAPAMSTLIIIGHVKDGIDLAEEHNLPQPLRDFIEQHHGTTLVEYFYHEATRLAEARPDHRTEVEESSFRYPGPKPQTREAGILMLADAVESASRTLTDPTPKRIESLVHNLTMKRLLDGQFDECSLKLSEIRTIEASLVKSLIGIYHGRIRYPEARPA